MTALSTRDALAKAIHDVVPPMSVPTETYWLAFADALLASGAVVDAATLANDEALRFTDEDIENAHEAMQEGEWQWFQWLLREKVRALAAALSEREARS
jgi:hypothetical protein